MNNADQLKDLTMTNRELLIKIRSEHPELTYAEIAKCTNKSWYTVKSWLLQPDSEAARGISDEDLSKIQKWTMR